MPKPDDIPQDVWDAATDHAKAVYSEAFLWDNSGGGDGAYLDSAITTTIIARAIMAERERFRPILAELIGEVVWNAYNVGIVRADGKWIDGGMSDAEQLRADLGFADVPQDAEALRAAIPGLIARKVEAAMRLINATIRQALT